MADSDGRFVEPQEGTEAERLYLLTEECFAMHCPLDAPDPVSAAALAAGEPWCPGHCAAYAKEMEKAS